MPARLPTQDELPYSDGDKLESDRHVLGMQLLISSLEPWLRRRENQDGTHGGYVAGNMFLYFSPEQVKGRSFRGPDVMVVLGADPATRKSWVVWDEGKAPDLIIELLSGTTHKTDKEIKPRIYRDEVGVRERGSISIGADIRPASRPRDSERDRPEARICRRRRIPRHCPRLSRTRPRIPLETFMELVSESKSVSQATAYCSRV